MAVAPPGVLVQLQALEVAEGQEHLLLVEPGAGQPSLCLHQNKV